ncbi:MAG: hypothetical protein ACXAEN_11915 [Candidatus Thorarchaeota archaeon]
MAKRSLMIRQRLSLWLRVRAHEVLGFFLFLQIVTVIVFALMDAFGLHRADLLELVIPKVVLPSTVFTLAMLLFGLWWILPQRKYSSLAAEARELIDSRMDHKKMHSMDGRFQLLITLMLSLFASLAILGAGMTRLGSILALITTGLFLASYQGAQGFVAIDLKLLIFAEAIAFSIASGSVLFWIVVGVGLYQINPMLLNGFTIILLLLAIYGMYVEETKNPIRTYMRREAERIVKENEPFEDEVKRAALGLTQAMIPVEYYGAIVLGTVFLATYFESELSLVGSFVTISFAIPLFLLLTLSFFNKSHLFRGGVMPDPPIDLPLHSTGSTTRRDYVTMSLILSLSFLVTYLYNLI